MSSRPSHNFSGFALLLLLLTTLVVATMAMPGPDGKREILDELAAELPRPPAGALRAPGTGSAAPFPRETLPVVTFLQIAVRDAQGRALPHADVTYYQESMIGFPEEARGSTDASGLFDSPSLPPGCYRIRAEAAGCQISGVQEIVLPAPADGRLQFTLLPAPD